MKRKTVDKSRTIARELERVRKEHGGLLEPKYVVAAAREKSSPLHSLFEWDNTRAAEAHRLWQARQLIVSVVLEVEDTPEKLVVTKYVSLPSDRKKGGGYRTLVSVVRDTDKKQELLDSLLADVRIFRAKYNAVKEAAEIIEAMDDAERRLRARRAA